MKVKKRFENEVFIINQKDSELFDRAKKLSSDIYYLIENLEFLRVGFVIESDLKKEQEKMEKITQKQIKELIKRILKGSYNDVLELRNRLTPDGLDVIFQEDYFKLDIVLDLYDLLDLLLNGGDDESIKDKFLEIAEFYHWDFESNDFPYYEEDYK